MSWVSFTTTAIISSPPFEARDDTRVPLCLCTGRTVKMWKNTYQFRPRHGRETESEADESGRLIRGLALTTKYTKLYG
uniref:Secreted protein n=1 Tax=Steinernema glaseri TaxID=37863 RepID=A0A1I7Y7J2_9BILA